MDPETASLNNGDSPICSVCIANYNGKNVLEACLNSVYQQDFSHPVEVIVHDDASTDGSAEIVSKNFPSVKVIRSESNVGFCVSNNRMVAAAKGRFILLLNNDAELHKNALSTLYNYSEKEKVYGIIGLSQYNKETGELIDVGSLLDPFLNPIPNLDILRTNVAMVIGACMWFPKQLWDELGGFPEWFESIAEDLYLCCLARLKGYPVIALPDSGFDHYVGGSFGGGKVVRCGLSTTYRRRTLSERNKNYVMITCYPVLLVLILFPLHIILLTIEGLLISFLKRDRRLWDDVYKTCLKELWTMRKKLARIRSEIQRKRAVSSLKYFSVHKGMPHKLKMLLKHGLPTVR